MTNCWIFFKFYFKKQFISSENESHFVCMSACNLTLFLFRVSFVLHLCRSFLLAQKKKPMCAPISFLRAWDYIFLKKNPPTQECCAAKMKRYRWILINFFSNSFHSVLFSSFFHFTTGHRDEWWGFFKRKNLICIHILMPFIVFSSSLTKWKFLNFFLFLLYAVYAKWSQKKSDEKHTKEWLQFQIIKEKFGIHFQFLVILSVFRIVLNNFIYTVAETRYFVATCAHHAYATAHILFKVL
jgi:hypothetical protein